MSKYRTRRQQKRDRFINKIKRLVTLTVLLSFIVLALFFYLRKKDQKPIVAEQLVAGKKTDTADHKLSKTPVADTLPAKTLEKEQLAEDSARQTQADSPEARPTRDTAKTLKKEITRELSEQEMLQIVSDISAQKTQTSNLTNCITIRKTSASNVANAFDIAALLKSKGFVISGRETVKDNVKGIAIDASGSCITLTVGTFSIP